MDCLYSYKIMATQHDVHVNNRQGVIVQLPEKDILKKF